MLIPEGFWFVQIRGRISDFCIRLCNALSRLEYPSELHKSNGRLLLVILHLCNVNMRWINGSYLVLQLCSPVWAAGKAHYLVM